jgi:hypothetical protein
MEFLDRAKYWILDLVHKGFFPIHILVHDELELVVNRAIGHGLNHKKLIDTLSFLFEKGLLIADLFEKSSNHSREITPTQQDIEDALAGKLNIHYGLSSLGGEKWEERFKPNWNLYIDDCYPKGSIVLGASDRRILEKYLDLLPYSSQTKVIFGSERWEPLIPWEVTSWKTLPSGWQVTCKTKNTNEYLGKIMPSEYREWLDKIDNWYTNPFDTTDNSI